MKIFAAVIIFAISFSVKANIIPVSLQCLWDAYPVFQIQNDGETIIFADGTEMPFNDHSGWTLKDDFEKILDQTANLEQEFLIPYKVGFPKNSQGQKYVPVPALNQDPGRIRYEPFFKKIYGATAAEVETQLVEIPWLVSPISVKFNRKFGAASALVKALVDLKKLTDQNSHFQKFIQSPLGGTFLWRKILGSPNLSVHSFAVAVDINTKFSNYWLWEEPTDSTQAPLYQNQIPVEVVEIFERHGFIWGGKWDHFDTMHFEYRPELLMPPQVCEKQFEKKYGRTESR